MIKTTARGLPEGLVITVREAIAMPATDATRAAALGRVLGWHLTVTGGYAPRRPSPPITKGTPRKRP